jgi:hypothetical protein
MANNSSNDSTEFAYRDIDHFFRKRQFVTHPHMERTVMATFHNRTHLDDAVRALQYSDFRNDDIFLTKSHNGSVLDTSLSIVSIAPFLVPLLIVVGFIIGNLLGLVTHEGYLSYFGISPFVDHSIITSMAAHGTVGAFMGGMLGTFYGMRIPEYQPWKYETSEPDGTLFLVVRTTNQEEVRIARQAMAPFLERESKVEIREQKAA